MLQNYKSQKKKSFWVMKMESLLKVMLQRELDTDVFLWILTDQTLNFFLQNNLGHFFRTCNGH